MMSSSLELLLLLSLLESLSRVPLACAAALAKIHKPSTSASDHPYARADLSRVDVERARRPNLSTPTKMTAPRVLVIGGTPCSGKTTLAAHACACMGGAALVDKDALEWPLANAALVAAGERADDHGCDFYKATLKACAYESCFRVAEQNARAGVDVVLVAPFSSYARDASWLDALRSRFGGASVALAWVTADAGVVAARRGVLQDLLHMHSTRVDLPRRKR